MAKNILKDFCDETTAHGFYQIADRQRKTWAKLMWLLVLLTFTGIFTWQAQLLVRRYLDYETNVDTTVTLKESMPFPTITICNINPYKKSVLANDSALLNYIKMFEQAANMTYVKQMITTCQNQSNMAWEIQLFCMRFMTNTSATDTTAASVISTGSTTNAQSVVTSTLPRSAGAQSTMTTEKSMITTAQPTVASSPTVAQSTPGVPQPNGTMPGGFGGDPMSPSPFQNQMGAPPPMQPRKKRQQPPPSGPGGSFDPNQQSFGPGSMFGQPPPMNPNQQPQSGFPMDPNSQCPCMDQDGPPDPRQPAGPCACQDPGPPGPRVSLIGLEANAVKDIGTIAVSVGQENGVSKYRYATNTKEDLFTDCLYNMDNCTVDEAEDHPFYGACYRINRDSNWTSMRPGPLYGLILQLDVNLREYLPSTFMVGVRVGVDQPGRMAFPQVNGVFAPVGAATAIGVAMVETNRLGQPYGDCVDRVQEDQDNDRYYFGGKYTLEGCLATCKQKQIIQACGCYSFAYPPQPKNPHIPLCKSISDVNCASKEEMKGNNCSSTCFPLCHDISYKLTVSHSVFPTPQTAKKCRPGVPECTDDHRSQNELKLLIYFESMIQYTYNENATYTLISLISDFGGQLGLWVGASFCTAIELIWLVISLVTSCCGCHDRSIEKRTGTKSSKRSSDLDAITVSGRSQSSAPIPSKQAIYPQVDTYHP